MREGRALVGRRREGLRIVPVLLVLAFAAPAQELPHRPAETVSIARRSPASTGTSDRRMTIDVRNVLVPATVTDPLGRAVTGLAQSAFQVFEDDVEQRVSYFAHEPAPVSVGILFDASASM